MGKFKSVCVFCGSKSGNKRIFSDAALDLGRELVERKMDLVYGGGSIGLMGLVSQTVYDGECHVLGVIPRALVPIEISGHTVGEVLIVSDMHERKAEMARRADAFVALPGGYGTFEELLEMITWSQLGIHNKPVRTRIASQRCPRSHMNIGQDSSSGSLAIGSKLDNRPNTEGASWLEDHE
ncbi:hypothetical protein D5086_025266 [Populus alba]|uniref:Uncharacterized protein n=4 Tax=Populus TaxID=3689 RepID=A0ACC4AYR8_POPAL|nr:hypothetical protein POTOM_012930 [Populus tomentosa]KAJ7005293.1 hypothetical protein NC653_009941 [Populus alba x Populus x berolinensis]TKS05038.1 hypothetical protein D5086_0000137320 [Populus alba]